MQRRKRTSRRQNKGAVNLSRPRESYGIVSRMPFTPIRREPGPAKIQLIGGYPDQKRVTLRYTEQISMTSTTGAITSQTFRGNSPFDPNQTGTGAQPANYDDWTAIYNKYCCLGSRICIQPTVSSAVSTSVKYVLCATDGAVTGVIDDLAAQPYAITGAFNAYSTSPCISYSMSTMKRLGKSKSQVLGDPNFNSVYNTNPVNQWSWEFNLQSADHSTTVASYVTFTVDYDIVFHERIDPGLNLLKHGPRKVEFYLAAAARLQAKIDARLELKRKAESQPVDEKSPDSEPQYIIVREPQTPLRSSTVAPLSLALLSSAAPTSNTTKVSSRK